MKTLIVGSWLIHDDAVLAEALEDARIMEEIVPTAVAFGQWVGMDEIVRRWAKTAKLPVIEGFFDAMVFDTGNAMDNPHLPRKNANLSMFLVEEIDAVIAVMFTKNPTQSDRRVDIVIEVAKKLGLPLSVWYV